VYRQHLVRNLPPQLLLFFVALLAVCWEWFRFRSLPLLVPVRYILMELAKIGQRWAYSAYSDYSDYSDYSGYSGYSGCSGYPGYSGY